MKLPVRSVLPILIIGFWIFMLALLIKKEFLPENISASKIRFPKKLPYKEDWAIYDNNTRVGYLVNEFSLQKTGYLLRNRSKIKNHIYVNGLSLFSKDKTLERIYLYLAYKDFIIDLKGIIKDERLRLVIKSDNSKKRYEIPWYINSDLMSNVIMPSFYKSGLKIGNKFQWYIINPLTQTRDLLKAIVRRSSFYYNRKEFIPVIIVDVLYQDMKFEFWIDIEGNPLKVITPWGWKLESE